MTTQHYFQLFGKVSVSSKHLFDSTFISRCNPATEVPDSPLTSSLDAVASPDSHVFHVSGQGLYLSYANNKGQRREEVQCYLSFVYLSHHNHIEKVRPQKDMRLLGYQTKITFNDLNPCKPSVPFLGHRQKVQTQIRRRRTQCLIRAFTVCYQEYLFEIE